MEAGEEHRAHEGVPDVVPSHAHMHASGCSLVRRLVGQALAMPRMSEKAAKLESVREAWVTHMRTMATSAGAISVSQRWPRRRRSHSVSAGAAGSQAHIRTSSA